MPPPLTRARSAPERWSFIITSWKRMEEAFETLARLPMADATKRGYVNSMPVLFIATVADLNSQLETYELERNGATAKTRVRNSSIAGRESRRMEEALRLASV